MGQFHGSVLSTVPTPIGFGSVVSRRSVRRPRWRRLRRGRRGQPVGSRGHPDRRGRPGLSCPAGGCCTGRLAETPDALPRP